MVNLIFNPIQYNTCAYGVTTWRNRVEFSVCILFVLFVLPSLPSNETPTSILVWHVTNYKNNSIRRATSNHSSRNNNILHVPDVRRLFALADIIYCLCTGFNRSGVHVGNSTANIRPAVLFYFYVLRTFSQLQLLINEKSGTVIAKNVVDDKLNGNACTGEGDHFCTIHRQHTYLDIYVLIGEIPVVRWHWLKYVF